ncbi:MAG: hypothetical protein JWO36_5477 [Myxococcales bacterium]|nr:hypothetical protein [Myxococcales bacterium]
MARLHAGVIVFATCALVRTLAAQPASDPEAAALMGRARAAAVQHDCATALQLREDAMKRGAKWRLLEGCLDPRETIASGKLKEASDAVRAGDCTRAEALAAEVATIHPEYHAAVIERDPSLVVCRLHQAAKDAAPTDCTRAIALRRQLRAKNPGYFALYVARDAALADCVAASSESEPVAAGENAEAEEPTWGLSFGAVNGNTSLGFTRFLGTNVAAVVAFQLIIASLSAGDITMANSAGSGSVGIRVYTVHVGPVRAFVQPGIAVAIGVPGPVTMGMISNRTIIAANASFGAEYSLSRGFSILGLIGAEFAYSSYDNGLSGYDITTATSSLLANIYW